MKTSMKPVALLSLLAIALLAACGQQASEQPATEPAAATTAEPALSVYAAAVASEARPDSDRARDAGRKPAEVLEFFGIEPGMTVLDLFTGGGYYAEIIAAVVGEQGKVIAQTNQAYLGFVGEEFEQRFGDGHLANVEVLMAENNELSLEENTLDAVMLVLSFHDLYHADPENGWPEIDRPAFLAELRKGLKPGGVVAIIDHYAAAGSPTSTGDTVHRIDPAIVLADMEAAGFVFEAGSDMLRNPDDDYSQIVFAEGIRGKTDRFLMRFRNPE
jgi:predicted methyltransferase